VKLKEAMSRTKGQAGSERTARAGAAGKNKPRAAVKSGRPTLEELDRRKVRILEVAAKLFLKEGFAGTSLVEIAQISGVATRTIYQHFGDKEDVFREVIFGWPPGSSVPLPKLDPSASLLESVTVIAYYIRAVSLDRRAIDTLRLIVAESKRFPLATKKVINAVSNKTRGNITQMFETLASYGIIEDSDHKQSAALLMDLILGNSLMMSFMDWRSANSDEDIQTKVRMFVFGRFGSQALEPRSAKELRQAAAPVTKLPAAAAPAQLSAAPKPARRRREASSPSTSA
jgi:TetR/AcrR family transcriptional repressor of mexJK operon